MVVVAKSVNPKRIRENFEATQVKLGSEDILKLGSIDKNLMLFKVGSLIVRYKYAVLMHVTFSPLCYMYICVYRS